MSETAVHDYPLPADVWWACEHPERPFDSSATAIDGKCYPCWLAAVAALKAGMGDEDGTNGYGKIVTVRQRVITSGDVRGWFERSGIDPETLR